MKHRPRSFSLHGDANVRASQPSPPTGQPPDTRNQSARKIAHPILRRRVHAPGKRHSKRQGFDASGAITSNAAAELLVGVS